MSKIQKSMLDMENTLVMGEHEIVEGRLGSKFMRKPDGKTWDCRVKIMNMSETDMEIDFIGFDSSIVNALRRIILAEVPTVVIDTANIYHNTSIIPDETLGHRLGLLPINVKPSFLNEYKDEQSSVTPENSVRFDLKVKCKTDLPEGSDVDGLTTVKKYVRSSHLKYVPTGDQTVQKKFKPIQDNILLAVLVNGQEINIEAFASKGCGRDHAKFMPAHCYYRLLPLIEITREVEGEQARKLQSCFSSGVITLTQKKGREIAKVENARNDSCSRNIFIHDDLKDLVRLGRKSDHFIFYIESQSCLKSHDILVNSLDIFIDKCDILLNIINKGTDVEMKE